MRRSIFLRILGLLALLIFVTGTSMSVYQIRVQRNTELDNGREKIRFLAKQLENLLMWDDRVAMHQTLIHMVEEEVFVRYAFVNRGGRVVAHSFKSGVPRGLLSLPNSAKEKDNSFPKVLEFWSKGDGILYDLTIPLSSKNVLLHLGLERSRIDRAQVPSILGIAAICGLFFAMLIYPAFKVATVITREVDDITGQLKEANLELEKRVAERTIDLREANERLEEGREQLAVTLRSIGDGVITTDVNSEITLLNRAAEGLTGWQQEEAVGRQLSEVFDIRTSSLERPIENPCAEVLRTGGIVSETNHTVLTGRDGRERVIAHSCAPIRDAKSQIVGVVMVVRDVTEQERLEVELQQSEKLESIGVLAGGIAHDFNNFLTGILGNISLAQLYTNESEPVFGYLERAEQAADRASDLSKRLLTFSKGNAPVKKANDIEQIVREAADLVLSGSNVSCAFDFQQGLPAVDVDAGQIGQVIHNLLLNAVQAMPDGGDIAVRCQAVFADTSRMQVDAGLYVRLIVEDHGLGIPKEQIAKIYDPFFTTKKSGSGLGLAVVHSIIKNHGGNIEIASRIGKGTTFTLYLPTTGEIPQMPKQELPFVASGKGRLLVMDDEEAVRTLVTNMLVSIGYDVECAAHGEEAIEKWVRAEARGEPFILLILDLTIPGGVGGRETIRRIRERGGEIKAIAISGYSTDPVIANPKAYGFVASIAKPFTISELCRTVQDVVVSSCSTKTIDLLH